MMIIYTFIHQGDDHIRVTLAKVPCSRKLHITAGRSPCLTCVVQSPLMTELRIVREKTAGGPAYFRSAKGSINPEMFFWDSEFHFRFCIADI